MEEEAGTLVIVPKSMRLNSEVVTIPVYSAITKALAASYILILPEVPAVTHIFALIAKIDPMLEEPP